MRVIAATTLFLATCGCAQLPPVSSVGTLVGSLAGAREQTQVTGFELRSLQSRDFAETKEVAFAATLSVLLDAGYRVQTADVMSGVIIAHATSVDRLQLDLRGLVATRQMPIASAFIETVPQGSRVRINFTTGATSSNVIGIGESAVRDTALYGLFFEQLGNEMIARRPAVPIAIIVELAEPVSKPASEVIELNGWKGFDTFSAISQAGNSASGYESLVGLETDPANEAEAPSNPTADRNSR